jgi:hypothetical protein
MLFTLIKPEPDSAVRCLSTPLVAIRAPHSPQTLRTVDAASLNHSASAFHFKPAAAGLKRLNRTR